MRWNFVLSEMWQGLRRNLTMTIATTLIIAIALAGLGGALVVRKQASSTHDFWFGKIEVSVFLKKDVTEPQRQAIQQELNSLPQVKQIYYESQHAAFLRFQQEFKNIPALVNNTQEGQLPESFRVKLKNPKQYNIVASAVQNLPGVDQVAAEAAALKKIFKLFDGMQSVALVIAIVMLVVAALLIFNNVRLAAYTRRREVGIMRLVGASDLYIQAPFILENAIAALVGTVLGSSFVVFLYWLLIDTGARSAFGGILNYIGYGAVFATIPWLLLVGLAITTITAVGTLQRYLRV